MSKKLLDGVNDVLKKTQIVSTTNLLTSLTNPGKQIFIDNAIQSWNEAIDHIYSKNDILRPQQGAEDQITLQTGVREYSLPCDLVQIRWPLHDETNGFYINKYPGGYEELRKILTQPGNYQGQPSTAAIDPIEGNLYIDMLPTSSENGNIYKYFYWKDTGLEKANDVFPFSDVVYRAMVPVVAELWRYNQNTYANDNVSKVNFGRAIRALKKEPDTTAYIKRYGGTIGNTALGYDPFEN